MQDGGVNLKRQSSRHRGSSTSEQGQRQAQHAERTEGGQRERGHVSQPKASALRLQSSRPPFASISAGVPSNRSPGTAAAAATAGATSEEGPRDPAHGVDGNSSQAQEACRLELPEQDQQKAPVDGQRWRADGAQHALTSLQRSLPGVQRSDPASGLQALTADKSLDEQESKLKLAERLGFIEPGERSARGFQTISHRPKSGGSSCVLPKAPVASQDSGDSKRAHTIPAEGRKQMAAELPEVMEMSGAEAQEDAPDDMKGQRRSQVSWLRPTAGGSRVLQVSADGSKEAMRHSQGLKVLLDDKARAQEAEQMQQDPRGERSTVEPASDAAKDYPANSDMPAAADGSDGLESSDLQHLTEMSEAQQLEDTADDAQAGTVLDSGDKSSEEAPASTPLPEKPQSKEGLLDSLVNRMHAAKASGDRAWSSRPQDSHWYAGPEGNVVEHGGARGAHKWRPRAPARRTARSALREGRPTVQVCRAWLVINSLLLGLSSGQVIERHSGSQNIVAKLFSV